MRITRFLFFFLLLLQTFTIQAQAPFKDSILQPQRNKELQTRIKWITAANIVGYSAAMAGLYQAWYKKYPQSSFHTFNDWREWKQMDKFGHFYSAYVESLGSMELWNWAGLQGNKKIWIGGLSGAAYQTIIEVLDGYSQQWGWSWGDIGANLAGSSLLIAQELAWREQRIALKFSYHNVKYSDPILLNRSQLLFGASTSSRFLKDYNGQTYWASVDISSFQKKWNWPKWLNIAVGYGAQGLLGGEANIGRDAAGNIVFDRKDWPRYRQWYLSPDINWKKIQTNKKGIRLLFTLLNAFKFPAPAIEYAHGRIQFLPIYF